MAKQRRAVPARPTAGKKPASRALSKKKIGKPARPSSAKGSRGRRAPVRRQPPRKPSAKPGSARLAVQPDAARRQAGATVSASHDAAVAAFERGFLALQRRQFDRAATAFEAVIGGFADEKDLQERARVYLDLCRRQAGQAAAGPRTVEERVNAATVAINRGTFDEALSLLRGLESENPDSDHVQYLLTVALVSTGAMDEALEHLRKAISLNPENRGLSLTATDLEPLRQHAGFSSAVEARLPNRRGGARRH